MIEIWMTNCLVGDNIATSYIYNVHIKSVRSVGKHYKGEWRVVLSKINRLGDTKYNI